MGHTKVQSVWRLVDRQHGVVARWQLLELGLSPRSVQHRLSTGRLHQVRRGVYAVGRPQLTRHGRWMAAVLSCGRDAALSHDDAGALWGMRPFMGVPTQVSVPAGTYRRRPGIVVHRRADLEVTRRHGIPVTTPIATLVDIAPGLGRDALEGAINEADKLDLVNPEQLRAALDALVPRPGLGVLRETLDRRTFTLTDSRLERLFLPIARRAGLSKPRPSNGSTATRWISIGPIWDWSWRPTAFATTALHRNRRGTVCETRRTRLPA